MVNEGTICPFESVRVAPIRWQIRASPRVLDKLLKSTTSLLSPITSSLTRVELHPIHTIASPRRVGLARSLYLFVRTLQVDILMVQAPVEFKALRRRPEKLARVAQWAGCPITLLIQLRLPASKGGKLNLFVMTFVKFVLETLAMTEETHLPVFLWKGET